MSFDGTLSPSTNGIVEMHLYRLRNPHIMFVFCIHRHFESHGRAARQFCDDSDIGMFIWRYSETTDDIPLSITIQNNFDVAIISWLIGLLILRYCDIPWLGCLRWIHREGDSGAVPRITLPRNNRIPCLIEAEVTDDLVIPTTAQYCDITIADWKVIDDENVNVSTAYSDDIEASTMVRTV
jgi:hypothetical protein